MNKNDICANDSITAKEFLLIDENGNSLGQVPRSNAFSIANERDLDLIQVNDSPAVVKLLRLDKYMYQLVKTQKENRKKQSTIETKTILLKLRIGFDAKEVIKKKARRFFEEGHKVLFNMKFRKKERVKIDEGEEIMKKLQAELSDCSCVVKELQRVGENLAVSMTLGPNKKIPEKKKTENKPQSDTVPSTE
jgi:translation initiation factor IF-3